MFFTGSMLPWGISTQRASFIKYKIKPRFIFTEFHTKKNT